MEKENSINNKTLRSMHVLAMVNVIIWACAIVAMVFLMQDAPVIKKIFPILAGGTAVGITQISLITRSK